MLVGTATSWVMGGLPDHMSIQSLVFRCMCHFLGPFNFNTRCSGWTGWLMNRSCVSMHRVLAVAVGSRDDDDTEVIIDCLRKICARDPTSGAYAASLSAPSVPSLRLRFLQLEALLEFITLPCIRFRPVPRTIISL